MSRLPLDNLPSNRASGTPCRLASVGTQSRNSILIPQGTHSGTPCSIVERSSIGELLNDGPCNAERIVLDCGHPAALKFA
jgi:hypothetical protein